MRKIGSSRGAVTAYPRQLESLIRLSEAHAKMRRVCLLYSNVSITSTAWAVLMRSNQYETELRLRYSCIMLDKISFIFQIF